MKRKLTLILVTICAILTLTACSKNKQASTKNSPSASNLISKIQNQELTSGNMGQILKIQEGSTLTAMKTQASWGGNPSVMQVNTYMSQNNQTREISEWINNQNVYVNVKKAWYKSPIKPLLGTDYQTYYGQLMANQSGLNFPKSVLKKMKVKDNITSYTLNYKVKSSDSTLGKQIVQNIITSSQDKTMGKTFSDALAKGQFKDYNIQAVINKKDNKLTSLYYSVDLSIGGTQKMTVQQSFTKLGTQDTLAIPNDVMQNAKDIKELVSSQPKK